jgi:signal transduction histidine kinase
VRRRLIAAIVGVATASLVLFALPLGVLVRRTYRDEELSRLQRDTVAATRGIDLAARGDPIELPPSRDTMAAYDATGRRLVGAGPAAGDPLVARALRSGKAVDEERGGQLVTAVPLVSREVVTGVVRAARSSAALDSRTRSTRLALLGLAAVVLALAVVAAVLLARRLAIPLERLSRSARRLGDGDFASRTAPSGVPELDALAGALDATADRLGELVSRERAFSADASHQLRTPLAALRLELEALELHGEPSAELSGALRQVDRLQTTIETLLSVARDSPQREHQSDLQEMLEALRGAWTGPLAELARPLRIRVGSATLRTRASAPVVREILEVLLSNACRHGAGAVTVSVRDAGEYLAVEVADEGPGVDEPDAVFTRRSDAAAGHGIGLSLARSLAHAEGGRLSLAGAGPRPVFVLMLPRVPESTGPNGAGSAAALPAATGVDSAS